jgi:F-type H+-transporting ATPase subunit b
MTGRLSLFALTGFGLSPAAFAAEKGTPFFADPTNWAGIALVVFFAGLWRAGVFKSVLGSLDARSEKIARELDEVRALREEAQKILAETERRQLAAEQEADAIIALAKKEAAQLIKTAREDMAERLARREKSAADRIGRAEIDAVNEVRRAAAELASKAAERILVETAKPADEFTRSLGELDKAL